MKRRFLNIKKLSFLTGLVLLTGSLVACGSDASSDTSQETAEEVTTDANDGSDVDITSDEAQNVDEEMLVYYEYEFETYDGEKVVLDQTNITDQVVVADVFEAPIIPEDAQVIAPGRDFVLLADDFYYYVQDTVNNMITIATKPVSITETVTYEFETFDGEVLVINEDNIVSQEYVEDPLESDIVPADAEVAAPGRDFVLLEDDNYYYVEDVINRLVTIVNK